MSLRGDSRHRRNHRWQREFPPEVYRDFYDRLRTVIASEAQRLVRDGQLTDRDESSVTHRAVLLALYAHHARSVRHGTDLRLGFSVALPSAYRTCVQLAAAGGTSVRRSVLDTMLKRWRAAQNAEAAERERETRLDELLYDPSREPSAERRRRPQHVRTRPLHTPPEEPPEAADEDPGAQAAREATAFLHSYLSELGHATAMHLAIALAERGTLDESHMAAAEASYTRRAQSAQRTGRWPNAREVVASLFEG